MIYAQTLKIFHCQSISLYRAKKKIRQWVDLEEKFVDMCVNSCEAFTGKKSEATSCSICKENRYNIKRKPRKVAGYFPLIPRIRMQYKDRTRSKQLMYRANYLNDPEKLGDIYDGELYKKIVNEGLLPDSRDIVFSISLDGYQIFRQQRDDCWVILVINHNLPPEVRVKKENLLIVAVIPGPKQPKDFNSFLQPLVDELKLLKG